MAVDYNLIGRRIAETRKEKGLTQYKLAEKADIGNTYLSQIENNRSIPSLETLMAICDALDVTPNHLLLGASDSRDDYLVSDLTKRLNQCNEREKRLIFKMIDVYLKERTKKDEHLR